MTLMTTFVLSVLYSSQSFAIDRGTVYVGETVGDGYSVTTTGSPVPTFAGHHFGIYVNSNNPASVTTVGNNFTVKTSGDEADGIRTNPSNNTAAGTIRVGDNLSITTGGLSSDAVNMNGGTILYIGNNATLVTEFAGTIPFLKEGAHGLRTNLTSQIHVGDGLSVETMGLRSYGIYTSGTDSQVTIGNGSTIKTHGNNANAAHVSGTRATLDVKDGFAWETSGDTAYGINFSAMNGSVTLGSNGTIDTAGSGAYGVSITSSAGVIALGNSNTITTGGDTAHGIYARSRDASVTFGDATAVVTGGDGAHGIFVTGTQSSSLTYSTDIVIGNGSSVKTTGAASYGVHVFAPESSVTMGENAVVETEGDGSHALYAHGAANATNNAIVVDKNATIKTLGEGAHAAYVDWASSAIEFKDGANVTAQGVDSYALYASEGQITSTVPGKFTVLGNMLSENGGVINLSMTDGSSFTGTTALGVTPGTLDLNIDGAQSVWNMTGDSVISSLTLGGATLSYESPAAGGTFTPKTLTVMGDYTSNNGVLVLNTVLGADDSLTDKLIVTGDVAAGTTKVSIVNVGGTGDQTIEGIEIVEVGGQSIGNFVKQSRIVAGAYDYDVVKGASNENWYLTSKIPLVEPEPEPDPDPEPEGPTPGGENQYRPEFGSYLANNYAANTMFLTRLHDRLGETQYTDVLTGEQKVTSMWMRNVGGHTRFRDSSSQLKTKSNRYVLQLGGDLAQWSTDGLDRWHLGAMAGYGNNRSKTVSSVTSHYSRGQVTGYSAGLYGTWYANEADKTGAYLDSWVLYNWFDNKVMGEDRATEKYKSRGVTASVEGGYSFKVGEQGVNSYWIQPKAQVVWMDVRAKDHYEQRDAAGGRTKVSDDTNGNLLTRLGVRTYMKGHSAQDEGKDREFQPFVEANWIHNTQNHSVKMAGVKDEMRGAKNIGEVKVGVEGQWNKRLNLWGNVAQQVGDAGYSDTSAMLGVKYAF
ncbi:hypothetical protein SOASR030_13790 [Leminorella grimontii]|uniref:Autotransporter domain-containing protein n=2 Tax=Leminorella grimontii TaxID=82981 RepID=A0AAV5N0K9_9GAMM|nr:hypothetical protein SOASR030_13790 [Leminorella grimontii]